MSDTGTYHRCRSCQTISTGPCCSKCKAPHVHSCDKDYVPWRMSFDNRALGTNIVECVRIDPNTGLPFAVVPGGGLGFPGDGSYPGFTNIPTDTDPPSPEIPEPPTDLDPDPDPDAPPGGIGDRSLVSLPTSCGGDPVSFDFTVYPGDGMPYLTVNWSDNGQAMPGTIEITDDLGTVIGPCDVLTPPAGGQVLTATFTPDAGCELVGFAGTPAPSGNYNGQVIANQYKASPADCPNTTPSATGTKAITVSYDPGPVSNLVLSRQSGRSVGISDDGSVIAISSIDNSGSSPKIYLSTDGGVSFSLVAIPGLPSSLWGFIYSCVVSADGNTIVVNSKDAPTPPGTQLPHIAYSHNKGSSWTIVDMSPYLSAGFVLSGVPSIAFHDIGVSSTGLIIAVMMYETDGASQSNCFVMVSSNGGLSWNRIEVTSAALPTVLQPLGLYLSPNGTRLVVVVAHDPLDNSDFTFYLSTDLATFTMEETVPSASFYFADMNDTEFVFAYETATSTLVGKTSDFLSHSDILNSGGSSIFLTAISNDGQTILALVSDFRLLRSVNGGSSWIQIPPNNCNVPNELALAKTSLKGVVGFASLPTVGIIFIIPNISI